MAATKKKKMPEYDPEKTDPHVIASAERNRDQRYRDGTTATPGILKDPADNLVAPVVDPKEDADLDPSVDNRDQVAAMVESSVRQRRLASGTTKQTRQRKSASSDDDDSKGETKESSSTSKS